MPSAIRRLSSAIRHPPPPPTAAPDLRRFRRWTLRELLVQVAVQGLVFAWLPWPLSGCLAPLIVLLVHEIWSRPIPMSEVRIALATVVVSDVLFFGCVGMVDDAPALARISLAYGAGILVGGLRPDTPARHMLQVTAATVLLLLFLVFIKLFWLFAIVPAGPVPLAVTELWLRPKEERAKGPGAALLTGYIIAAVIALVIGLTTEVYFFGSRVR